MRNSSYFPNDWRICNEIFRKDVTYHNINSHIKPVLHPLFKRYIFRKSGGQIDLPPAVSRLSPISYKQNFRKLI